MIKKLVSNKLNIKNLIFALMLCLIIACLVANPNRYIKVCLEGILVFGKNILPALFPFIFFTKLLTSTGYVEHISNHLSPITKKLYNAPAISAYVFLMSILSGYPLGAKITADLYEKGEISREEAHRICSFTSNSGPMFIIGTVGVGMMANAKIGYIILISHIISALLNGTIYKKYTPKYVELTLPAPSQNKKKDLTLSECMENSIISVLLIGGYIAIFFIITEILSALNIFYPVIKLLEMLGIEGSISTGVINGLFEITNGCKSISVLDINVKLKTILASFIISFGGLAVAFQGLTFLDKFKISKRFFFLQKFTQAIISTVITIILCAFIPL